MNAGRFDIVAKMPEGSTREQMLTPDGQMKFEMSKITMAAFADMPTRLVDRPVLDMTDLKGNYQVALDLSLESLLLGLPARRYRLFPAAPSSHLSNNSGSSSMRAKRRSSSS